jgi:uncharacterized protein (DUF2164 family)
MVMLLPIKLPKEDKSEIIKQVQIYFTKERDDTIGELAAEQLTDFMIRELGPYIYNKAVADTRALLQEKLNQLEDELYALEKPLHRR